MSIYRINFLDAKNTIVDATFGDHDTDEAVLADASGLRGYDAQAAKRAHALRQIAHSLPGAVSYWQDGHI